MYEGDFPKNRFLRIWKYVAKLWLEVGSYLKYILGGFKLKFYFFNVYFFNLMSYIIVVAFGKGGGQFGVYFRQTTALKIIICWAENL